MVVGRILPDVYFGPRKVRALTVNVGFSQRRCFRHRWDFQRSKDPEDCFEGLADWVCYAGRGTERATNRYRVIPHCPRSSCGTWFSAGLCSEAATFFFFPPFFAIFSANSSQPLSCSQPAELLLQNCTALTEVYFIYTPVPCPCPAGTATMVTGTATWSQGHGDLSPQTLKHPLQSSLPLHSPCWPSWFKSVGGGQCSSSLPCHSQHSVPEEASWEHQCRASTAAAETICRCALNTNTGFSSGPWGSGLWRHVKGKCQAKG